MATPPFPAERRTVTRAGHTFRVWDETPFTGGWDFWTAFEDHWELELDEILDAHLDPDAVMVDVGAWIGPVTLMAAARCRHVHAVEPDPVAVQRLAANVALAQAGNVTIYPVAVAAEDGNCRIGRLPDREYGDSMTSIMFGHDAVDVPAVTLETLVRAVGDERIGMVKMDIEGGETIVLPQAAGFLRRLGAPLLLSLHGPLATDPARYQRVLAAALAGFDCTVVAGTWDSLGAVLAIPHTSETAA